MKNFYTKSFIFQIFARKDDKRYLYNSTETQNSNIESEKNQIESNSIKQETSKNLVPLASKTETNLLKKDSEKNQQQLEFEAEWKEFQQMIAEKTKLDVEQLKNKNLTPAEQEEAVNKISRKLEKDSDIDKFFKKIETTFYKSLDCVDSASHTGTRKIAYAGKKLEKEAKKIGYDRNSLKVAVMFSYAGYINSGATTPTGRLKSAMLWAAVSGVLTNGHILKTGAKITRGAGKIIYPITKIPVNLFYGIASGELLDEMKNNGGTPSQYLVTGTTTKEHIRQRLFSSAILESPHYLRDTFQLSRDLNSSLDNLKNYEKGTDKTISQETIENSARFVYQSQNINLKFTQFKDLQTKFDKYNNLSPDELRLITSTSISNGMCEFYNRNPKYLAKFTIELEKIAKKNFDAKLNKKQEIYPQFTIRDLKKKILNSDAQLSNLSTPQKTGINAALGLGAAGMAIGVVFFTFLIGNLLVKSGTGKLFDTAISPIETSQKNLRKGKAALNKKLKLYKASDNKIKPWKNQNEWKNFKSSLSETNKKPNNVFRELEKHKILTKNEALNFMKLREDQKINVLKNLNKTLSKKNTNINLKFEQEDFWQSSGAALFGRFREKI